MASFSQRFGLDYISLDTIPLYTESAPVVDALGYTLVELQIVPQKTLVKITAVIAQKNPDKDIGVNDCAKAHHALQPKLTALLHKTEDDIAMEVCSPGMERNFKNAAEFAIFIGREVRVWDKNVSDWVGGIIDSADDKQVTLEVTGGEKKSIAYNDIAKAKFIHG
jgi:ribosome maturation factor RimP